MQQNIVIVVCMCAVWLYFTCTDEYSPKNETVWNDNLLVNHFNFPRKSALCVFDSNMIHILFRAHETQSQTFNQKSGWWIQLLNFMLIIWRDRWWILDSAHAITQHKRRMQNRLDYQKVLHTNFEYRKQIHAFGRLITINAMKCSCDSEEVILIHGSSMGRWLYTLNLFRNSNLRFPQAGVSFEIESSLFCSQYRHSTKMKNKND